MRHHRLCIAIMPGKALETALRPMLVMPLPPRSPKYGPKVLRR